MNETELGMILDRMGTAFRATIEPEVFQVWWDIVGGYDGPVALVACDQMIATRTDRGFPMVGEFQQVYAGVKRQQAREAGEYVLPGKSPDCPICGGKGWFEVDAIDHVDEQTGEVRRDEQWKPCQRCDPQAYGRWVAHNRERRTGRRLKPEDLLSEEPTTVFQRAHDELKKATEKIKNASP